MVDLVREATDPTDRYLVELPGAECVQPGLDVQTAVGTVRDERGEHPGRVLELDVPAPSRGLHVDDRYRTVIQSEEVVGVEIGVVDTGVAKCEHDVEGGIGSQGRARDGQCTGHEGARVRQAAPADALGEEDIGHADAGRRHVAEEARFMNRGEAAKRVAEFVLRAGEAHTLQEDTDAARQGRATDGADQPRLHMLHSRRQSRRVGHDRLPPFLELSPITVVHHFACSRHFDSPRRVS